MRLLAIVLFLLIAGLQYSLWVGKGGWFPVWQAEAVLAEQRANNQALRERNHALSAEVGDLKKGYDALEERARNELGMIKDDEIFFQLLDRQLLPTPTPTPTPVVVRRAPRPAAHPDGAAPSAAPVPAAPPVADGPPPAM